MLRVLFVIGLALGLVAGALGQRVTEEDGFTNSFSGPLRTEIEKNGPGWFPIPTIDEPDGTEIAVTSDFNNVDLNIVFEKRLLPQILPKAIAMLRRLGLTKTHLIVSRGRMIGCLDLEFNEYLRKDTFHSAYDLPLGALIDDIKGWGLPKPIGVAVVKHSSSGVAIYQGKKVNTAVAMAIKDIPADAVVHLSGQRHWWGLISLLVFGALILGFFGLTYCTLWASARKNKEGTPKPEPKPKTLAEAQARYDKAKPSRGALVILAAPLAMVFMTTARGQLEDGFEWIPQSSFSFAPFVIVVPVLLFIPLFLSLRRKKKPDTPQPAPLAKWAFRVSFGAFGLMMALMLITAMHPSWLYWIPRSTLRLIPLFIAPVAGVGMMIALLRGTNTKTAKPTTLSAGDSDYDAAMEFAKLARVKVRRVRVIDSSIANAYAGLFGTVGLTKGLREKLTQEERRCVIAHEVGHLKARHVPALVVFSLIVVTGAIGLEVWMRSHLSSDYHPLAAIIGSPLVTVFGVTFLRSPLQRRNEHSADRFALKAVGDYYAVATALAKIHLVNASPYQTQRLHAALSTHPSLKKRLEALRETALEMGIAVPADAVDTVIASVHLEEEETIEETSSPR